MASLEGTSWEVWPETAAIPPGINRHFLNIVCISCNYTKWPQLVYPPPSPPPAHQSPSLFHPTHFLAPLALHIIMPTWKDHLKSPENHPSAIKKVSYMCEWKLVDYHGNTRRPGMCWIGSSYILKWCFVKY